MRNIFSRDRVSSSLVWQFFKNVIANKFEIDRLFKIMLFDELDDAAQAAGQICSNTVAAQSASSSSRSSAILATNYRPDVSKRKLLLCLS